MIAPDKPLSGLSILLAEDVEINRTILISLLQDAGAKVTGVVNGQDASRAITPPRAYDFVLMDLHMPVMDGLEATISIRSQDDPDCATIPIIILSADPDPEQKAALREAGVNGLLAKPMELEALASLLREVLPERPEDGPSASDTARHAATTMDRAPQASAPVTPVPSTPTAAASGSSSGAEIDLKKLSDYAGLFGPEGLGDLVTLFATQGPDLAGEIAQAMGDPANSAAADLDAAISAAHKLASAAGSLGLVELETRCRAFEAAPDNDLLVDITRLVGDSLAGLQAFLAGLDPEERL
ncbi:MAG: Hpt domain-containing response regulator [Rhodospirillaceae bacterium]